MNSQDIYATIEAIASASGHNEKQAILAANMPDADFRRVLSYAYNPFMTFGIRQMPVGKAHTGYKLFDEATWNVLDALIARKLTGDAASRAVAAEVDALSSPCADLLIRIIRKDLRAGFSESTINKAYKGLIPEFPYMRCSLPKHVKLAAWPWAQGVFSQEKADAMFANLDHEIGGRVALRSRQGSEFPIEKFPEIVADVQAHLIPGNQQHGEIVVYHNGFALPRAESNGVMNRILKGGDFEANERPVYLIWDQIPLASVVSKGRCETSYRTRIKNLMAQLESSRGAIALVPTRVVFSLAEAYAHAAELMKLGKEGTVVKHPEGIWRDTGSAGSEDQVKIKLEFNVDLEIEAIVPGNAGTKNEGRAGSFACRTSDGLLKVDVTVKNEKLRDRVDAHPDEFIGKIIAVTANDITVPSDSNPLHSLFLPRMAEGDYRTDKSYADNLRMVFAQKEAAIFGKSLVELEQEA